MNPIGETHHTTVTVDSFQSRDSIPAERFVVIFPVGSRVIRFIPNAASHYESEQFLVVAEDGSLVPAPDQRTPSPALPSPELASLHQSLWVVGAVVTVFIGFVVLCC
jgi:hypothetical protein